jgi:hypothetical protein
MWDSLCKLISEELYYTRFQKDSTVEHIILTHSDVKGEAGNVDNTLYKFVPVKGTI